VGFHDLTGKGDVVQLVGFHDLTGKGDAVQLVGFHDLTGKGDGCSQSHRRLKPLEARARFDTNRAATSRFLTDEAVAFSLK
jgi:hypothetical protein